MLVIKTFAVSAMLALASCTPGAGEPELVQSDAWVRETAPGQSTAAVYLTIANRGSGDDRLIGVASPAAREASAHETVGEGGIARMRAIGGLPLPAGETVRLAPGGAHIMVEGLSRPLRRGERLALELAFERSSKRRVEAEVVEATAEGPGHEGHR